MSVSQLFMTARCALMALPLYAQVGCMLRSAACDSAIIA